jgi:hypothetical protein
VKHGKQTAILKDVLFKHHPWFMHQSTDHNFLSWAYGNPKVFNVEALVEEALAHCGGYAFIDAAHKDFSDGTDSKTASVSLGPTKEGTNSYRVNISGLSTSTGALKSGDLRVTLYVAPLHELQYYMIPHEWWVQKCRKQPSAVSSTLIATWNRTNNEIPRLKQFRLPSFESLAKAKASK